MRMRLSDVSITCCIAHFQFLIQSAFLPYIGRQTAPALRRSIGFNTQYRTTLCQKFGQVRFLYTAYSTEERL